MWWTAVETGNFGRLPGNLQELCHGDRRERRGGAMARQTIAQRDSA
jgi:hypothetical protein